MRAARAAVALLLVAGCATERPKEGESAKASWVPNVTSIPLLTPKGTKATLISELTPGAYQASNLAVGEEKDLARQRAQGLGFVRSAPVEQHLAALRAKLVAASGVTGVPGRVMILADPAFSAVSTADGNVYVAMGCLESLNNDDEVAAVLAHELAHVLLKHHTSDIVSDVQKKAQTLHEIGVYGRTAFSSSKTVSKSDTRALANEQLIADVTDKVALPAWSRRQEREADLLGVDLLIRAGYSKGAMVRMLEKLQAWEKQAKASEESFWDKVKQVAMQNPGEALVLSYQRAVDSVSTNHPKTDQRIDDATEYVDRHYDGVKPRDLQTGPWKAVTGQPDASQVMRHYRLAFSAKDHLAAGKNQEAYAAAKEAATGKTATDAYPNWMLARSAYAVGRQREASDALRRAISSPEPVPEIYELVILDYERAGNIATALQWTDRASVTFGGAPRFVPPKIRLLRKAGRTSEADALTLNCSLNMPDVKRQCQQANQTAAGRPTK